MKKRVFGRKFKKDTDQRKALFKSLMSSFILRGRIKTTEAKAKAVRGEIEKLVTKAKKRGKEAKFHLLKFLRPNVVDKLILDIAPKFKARPGGYTRILRLGRRVKDNAQMVILEWVEATEVALQQTKPALQKEAEKVVAAIESRKTEKEQTEPKKIVKGKKEDAKRNKSDKKK